MAVWTLFPAASNTPTELTDSNPLWLRAASLAFTMARDIDLVRGRRYIFSLRGKTTFKRYAEDPIRLDPESLNPAHEPHFIKPTDKWSVIGRVRKVIIDV